VDRSGPRRYAPADFISRHLKGWFTFFIADEAHELKGATTAQGQAFGRLAAAAHRTLILTGTLSGGLASNIHLLIARIAIPPPLTEEVRTVEMDAPLRAAYDELRQDLRSAVVHALHQRYRGLLGSYITTLLAYLDHPAGFSPIRHPSQDTIIAVPRSLPLDHLYAKDRVLLEIIEEEIAVNRRVFVFVTNTERHDAA